MKHRHLDRTPAALGACLALAASTASAQTPATAPAPATAAAPAAAAAPAPAAPAPAAPAAAPADANAAAALPLAPWEEGKAKPLRAPRPAKTNAPSARRAPVDSADAAGAPAASDAAAPPPVDVPRPTILPPDTPLIDGWLGVQGLVVPSATFDAFSDDDSLTSFTAGLGVSIARSGTSHIAVVGTVSTGGVESTYRGEATELSVLRLALGPELRLPFLGRLYAYGRLSPQLVRTSASLAEASSLSRLTQEEWLFGIDSAVGISARLAEVSPDSNMSPVCFFARAEAGYTWTPESEIELTPASANAPIRSEPLALGDLSVSGISFRGAVGVGY